MRLFSLKRNVIAGGDHFDDQAVYEASPVEVFVVEEPAIGVLSGTGRGVSRPEKGEPFHDKRKGAEVDREEWRL